MSLHLIWAQDCTGVIGKDGAMPWHLPEDMAHFRRTTDGYPVVMGRATWQSLPAQFRPLPGRENLVLSRQEQFIAEGAHVLSDVAEIRRRAEAEQIWCIGGAQLYRELLPHASELVITFIQEGFAGDTFAPDLAGWQMVRADPEEGWFTSRTGLHYRFGTYRRAAAVAKATDGELPEM